MTTAAAEIAFEQYEVVIGPAQLQTVLTGFLLGGAIADLAVVNIDENDDRRLRVYTFGDGTWLPKLDATLGPEVLFVDVANIGGHDRLVTYEQGRLNWFDPESETERALVTVPFDFTAPPEGGIPRVDITRDLNRDGRDDLLVPDVDGFWVSTQLSNGTFTDPMKLGPAEPFLDEAGLVDSGMDDSRSYGEVGINAWTLPLYLSRVHEMDYNQDGRSDLVFWNQDHFEVYLQDENGLFASVAETFNTDVPFDSEGAYSYAFEFSDQGVFSFLFGFGKKTKRTVLHSLRDLNGDGVADLVTLTLSGRSAAKQRSVYKVHFGTVSADGADAPGGTVFAPQVGTVIRPRGKGGAMQPWGYSVQRFEDFDGDGQVDIMFRDVNVGLGGMTRALIGNSVGLDLEFYCIDDGIYPDKPTIRRKVRRFAPFAGVGNVFLPVVLMGDVNGDGRSDLLVGKSPKELHIFIGVPGPDLFARQPQTVAVTMPNDERNTWLVGLNRDGKQDILIHHPSTTEPHRLTTLIAQ